ncbi:adenylate kinase [Pimelobacter simplex]|uniref:adenylate kinase n=1 Tax=Nocardioides simplex TaxID=2045 RepID=UPI00214FFCFF|nr:adenylate kinase [Pimelobacter simplex]UUW90517.1 adenylate kinase [Pimelobacter simplex]UUW94347.1 adenylate kinase [Pimelobacter simplex]
MRLLIMGAPGAGKGTQAVALAALVDGPHISTGDLFRSNIAQGTELGRLAEKYISAGEYVPDAVTDDMVRDRLAAPDAREAFVLDGYPRTSSQVASLDALLSERGLAIDRAVELVVPEEELVDRLVARAAVSGRSDDTADVVRHRLGVYAAQTAPLLASYGGRGVLHRVDGTGSVEEVRQRVAEVVLRNLAKAAAP